VNKKGKRCPTGPLIKVRNQNKEGIQLIIAACDVEWWMI